MGASRNNALDLVLDNIRRFAALPRGRNRLSFGSAVGFVITPRPGGERPRLHARIAGVSGAGGTGVAAQGPAHWCARRAGRAGGQVFHDPGHLGEAFATKYRDHGSGAAGRGSGPRWAGLATWRAASDRERVLTARSNPRVDRLRATWARRRLRGGFDLRDDCPLPVGASVGARVGCVGCRRGRQHRCHEVARAG